MTRTMEYSRLQKQLHWAVVLLLAAQYLFLDAMGRAFHRTVETGSPDWTVTTTLHLLIGSLILLLALWRIALRLMRGAPLPPAGEPQFAKTAARVTHVAFYILLIALPLGGIAAWFFGLPLMGELHEIGTNLLLIVVGLHVAAVLLHQVWWKTNLLARMR